MSYALPENGLCPACGREFMLAARTGSAMDRPFATDALEQRCSACSQKDIDDVAALDRDWP